MVFMLFWKKNRKEREIRQTWYVPMFFFLLGVRRRTKEDKEFAEFDIFDDPATPYSTFNFKYSHLAFERLSRLTEFNTLLKVDEIKSVICDMVEKKRNAPSRCPCTLDAVPLLRKVSQKNKKRLSKFLSRLKSGRFSASEARKGIDKSIEEETITEETTAVDVSDSPVINDRIKRKGGFSKRNPLKNGKTPTLTLATMDINDRQETQDTGSEDTVAERREIPGRRKPRQHERAAQWHDTRCFSLDEDDDTNSQFFTAVQADSPR